MCDHALILRRCKISLSEQSLVPRPSNHPLSHHHKSCVPLKSSIAVAIHATTSQLSCLLIMTQFLASILSFSSHFLITQDLSSGPANPPTTALNPLDWPVGETDAVKKLEVKQKKNTHSHFLLYLHELFVDLNKNCSEYTQGLIDSDNVKIRYSLRSMT